jgi:transcriptional regulator with XRE-family HTH domain
MSMSDATMTPPKNTVPEQPRVETALGNLIRFWRDKRGRSQLQLSFDMGVSQRHISFVESGRSAPSRGLLLGLAEALSIPFRDRNALLLAAGFAPIYSDGAWNSAEMRAVNRALERMLRQHEPFPAIAMDRHWNVLMTNAVAFRFFGTFFDLSRQPSDKNLLRMILDPHAMRPFIDNWEEVTRGVLERLNRESAGGSLDGFTRGLVDELVGYPTATMEWAAKDNQNTSPVIAFSFVKDGQLLKYFSMASTVAMPQMVASQELRVESFFPADDATEQWHWRTFAPNDAS